MHGCGRMGSVFNRNTWATYGKKKSRWFWKTNGQMDTFLQPYTSPFGSRGDKITENTLENMCWEEHGVPHQMLCQ